MNIYSVKKSHSQNMLKERSSKLFMSLSAALIATLTISGCGPNASEASDACSYMIMVEIALLNGETEIQIPLNEARRHAYLAAQQSPERFSDLYEWINLFPAKVTEGNIQVASYGIGGIKQECNKLGFDWK